MGYGSGLLWLLGNNVSKYVAHRLSKELYVCHEILALGVTYDVSAQEEQRLRCLIPPYRVESAVAARRQLVGADQRI